jgi:hypothetical protein
MRLIAGVKKGDFMRTALCSSPDFDGIEVQWPNGDPEKFGGGSAHHLIISTEGSGRAKANPLYDFGKNQRMQSEAKIQS